MLIKWTTSVLFVAMLLAVTAQTAFHFVPDPTLLEKRRMAALPQVSSINELFSDKFTEGFNAYINDNFGFRKLFIRASNFVDVKLLRTSTNTNVLIGRDGYLFDMADWQSFVHRHSDATEQELRTGAERIRDFQDRLQRQGLVFLLVLSPNKGSVYPEFMPRAGYRLHATSERERWSAALAQAGVNYFDPTDLLVANKSRWPMYYKGDHHWTRYGSLLVSNYIIHFLAGKLKVPAPELQIVGDRADNWESMGGGSLDELLGVRAARSNSEPIVQIHGQRLPPGLVIGDSFTRWLYLNDASVGVQTIEKQFPVREFERAIKAHPEAQFLIVNYWESNSAAYTGSAKFWK